MPTTFMSLPLELRVKIYEFALPDATVTLKVKTKMNREATNDGDIESWFIPSQAKIKAELATNKNLIALLYISREAHQCVQGLIYNNISVSWDSEDADPAIEGAEDHHLIGHYLGVPGLRALMDRAKINLVPNDIQIIWQGRVVEDQHDLPTMNFYRNDGSVTADLADW